LRWIKRPLALAAQHAASSPSRPEIAMYKRILVPFDGSETSTKALVSALQLAREGGGRVRIVYALDDLAYVSGYEYACDLIASARTWATESLAKALDIARSAGVPADSKLLEAPGRRLGEMVADEARAWEADLVAVGTHGRRGLGRALLGSGAEQVIRMAPVPVLAVRLPEPAAEA
jgi:nucleotide-binding universal stress UspA family protein